jgi:hypothetical protein
MDIASNFELNIFQLSTSANMANVKIIDDVSNKDNLLLGTRKIVPVLN